MRYKVSSDGVGIPEEIHATKEAAIKSAKEWSALRWDTWFRVREYETGKEIYKRFLGSNFILKEWQE